jgi:hypothetical protein
MMTLQEKDDRDYRSRTIRHAVILPVTSDAGKGLRSYREGKQQLTCASGQAVFPFGTALPSSGRSMHFVSVDNDDESDSDDDGYHNGV